MFTVPQKRLLSSNVPNRQRTKKTDQRHLASDLRPTCFLFFSLSSSFLSSCAEHFASEWWCTHTSKLAFSCLPSLLFFLSFQVLHQLNSAPTAQVGQDNKSLVSGCFQFSLFGFFFVYSKALISHCISGWGKTHWTFLKYIKELTELG